MYELRLTTNAENDLRALDAKFRASVIAAMREHLTHEPAKTSKSRIKRLRELKLPQYRLRVATIRVYYDVGEDFVMVYGIVPKAASYDWLDEHGLPYDYSPIEPG
jgi:mRNA interferase RelE/StbE